MRTKYPMMRRRMAGRGKVGDNIMKWLGKINKFLKKSKVLSVLGQSYNPSNPFAKAGLSMAKQEGYGRRRRVVRRRRKGGSLRPVGGGITSLAPQ